MKDTIEVARAILKSPTEMAKLDCQSWQELAYAIKNKSVKSPDAIELFKICYELSGEKLRKRRCI